MGRFFDAVASLCGVRQQVNYEAQAAIEFEALADPDETREYDFIIESDANLESQSFQIDCSSLFEEIINDLHNGDAIPVISARFHNSVARMVILLCNQMRNDYGVKQVVLSGGVWQNLTLLRTVDKLLSADGFTVHIHHQVPTNDGGLALGQAVVAIHRMT